MKRFLKAFLLGALLSCRALFFCGAKEAGLRIVSWNLQTFFDGVTDGSEYQQFKGTKSPWSEKKYMARLEKLASALRAFDADLVVLEELEKAGQLHDIYNQLSGTFRFSSLYRYGAFASEPGAAIGVGVLSRFPLSEARAHALDIGSERARQPALRPLLELVIQRDGRKLTLFVCHWKSKSGGEEASEIWRNFSENQLANLLSCDGNPYFIAGDFNRDLYEFNILSVSLSQGYTGCVEFGRENLSKLQTEKIKVNSAWLTINSSQVYKDEGTYYYQNEWEKLDHFFFSPTIELENFFTLKTDENLTENGTPFRYSVWNGKGYSDHFPIICIVNF